MLSFVCIIVYSSTLNAPFIFDDLPNIEHNSYVRLTEFDYRKVYDAAFRSPNPGRLLANLSFALNHYFWGNNVAAFHNLMAHNRFGVALARQGKYKEAVDHFKETLRVRPDYSTARKNLELALIQIRKSSQ